jgi:hypothetical protein
MNTFPTGTRSVLGRCISAEVRARLAAERVNLRDFSERAGFASHNYPAIRLRDERPFTTDDVQLIANYFEVDPHAFVDAAYEAHSERLYDELLYAQRDAAPGPADDLAARRGSNSSDGAPNLDHLKGLPRAAAPKRRDTGQGDDDA